MLRLRGGGPGDHIDHNVTAEMAIAAGGLIKQSIHRDSYDSETWDPSSTMTFNVQILNAKIFKKATGKTPPKCPINAKTYLSKGFSFFDIPEDSSSIDGNFKTVQSVGHLGGLTLDSQGSDDEERSGYEPLDYDFISHINRGLASGEPKREFRTASDILNEVNRANVVSFGR